MNTKNNNATYEAAGVNIDAGNRLVERIKPLAKATARSGSLSSLGGFGALFDLKQAGYDDPILVSTTDGVGTKLKFAIHSGIHATIGIDLVAMCVNDLIVQGAEPLFFLDYFATGALKIEQGAAIIGGIAEGCKQAGCALVGGETAEMPGMYAGEDYDLAGFAVGAVNRDNLLPYRDIAAGDALLGLASSGLHSNGFSLVRHILKNGAHDYSAAAPFAPGKTFAEAFLTPTRIYVKSCLAALRKTNSIKALAHITGGGLTENLPRVLPDGIGAMIDLTGWNVSPVFSWLRAQGNISESEMLRTFNCGIGMVLVVDKAHVRAISDLLTKEGETVYRIGELTARGSETVIFNGSLA